MMNFALTLSFLAQIGILTALPLHEDASKTDIAVLRRSTRSTSGEIGCRHMASTPGEMWYQSQGAVDVCGLYLIGEPHQIVELEITNFDISCETGGLLAVFDGWELNGELFPGIDDHELTMATRYKVFCGEDKPQPKQIFLSSQNVALIQFRIPEAGEGFRVKVNYRPAPQPCNAVAMLDSGELTMKNYGNRRNCTVSIIYPEKIQLVNVEVGVSPEKETGLLSRMQCMNMAGGDYVQLMLGQGLDTSMMQTRGIFCGMDSTSERKVVLGCAHSVVRMVSSGEFDNTVTFRYAPLTPTELSTSGEVC